MWEDILKGQGKAKKLNFNFLKEVSLGLAERFKGRILSRDEFLDFLEQIRIVYSVRHKAIPVDRISHTVIKILKRNDLLEIKTLKKNYRVIRQYIFKE